MMKETTESAVGKESVLSTTGLIGFYSSSNRLHAKEVITLYSTPPILLSSGVAVKQIQMWEPKAASKAAGFPSMKLSASSIMIASPFKHSKLPRPTWYSTFSSKLLRLQYL